MASTGGPVGEGGGPTVGCPPGFHPGQVSSVHSQVLKTWSTPQASMPPSYTANPGAIVRMDSLGETMSEALGDKLRAAARDAPEKRVWNCFSAAGVLGT